MSFQEAIPSILTPRPPWGLICTTYTTLFLLLLVSYLLLDKYLPFRLIPSLLLFEYPLMLLFFLFLYHYSFLLGHTWEKTRFRIVSLGVGAIHHEKLVMDMSISIGVLGYIAILFAPISHSISLFFGSLTM